jgi:hypothetical protein
VAKTAEEIHRVQFHAIVHVRPDLKPTLSTASTARLEPSSGMLSRVKRNNATTIRPNTASAWASGNTGTSIRLPAVTRLVEMRVACSRRVSVYRRSSRLYIIFINMLYDISGIRSTSDTQQFLQRGRLKKISD